MWRPRFDLHDHKIAAGFKGFEDIVSDCCEI